MRFFLRGGGGVALTSSLPKISNKSNLACIQNCVLLRDLTTLPGRVGKFLDELQQ